jgi:hypothetical protein
MDFITNFAPSRLILASRFPKEPSGILFYFFVQRNRPAVERPPQALAGGFSHVAPIKPAAARGWTENSFNLYGQQYPSINDTF